ncbi:MAG: hypothetical protein ACRDOL_26440 [Streptosporangiaceae bacterium]
MLRHQFADQRRGDSRTRTGPGWRPGRAMFTYADMVIKAARSAPGQQAGRTRARAGTWLSFGTAQDWADLHVYGAWSPGRPVRG